MNLYKDKEVFEELIEATASSAGFSFQIIEKDYYVTEILKSVCNKQKILFLKVEHAFPSVLN